jgi:hypothetical protein
VGPKDWKAAVTRDEILTGLREAMAARTAAEDSIDTLVEASYEVAGVTWDDIGGALSLEGRQAYSGRQAWEWLHWDGEYAVGPEPPAEWFAGTDGSTVTEVVRPPGSEGGTVAAHG